MNTQLTILVVGFKTNRKTRDELGCFYWCWRLDSAILKELLDSGRRLGNSNIDIPVSLGSYLVRTFGSRPSLIIEKPEMNSGVSIGAGGWTRTNEARSARDLQSLVIATRRLQQLSSF